MLEEQRRAGALRTKCRRMQCGGPPTAEDITEKRFCACTQIRKLNGVVVKKRYLSGGPSFGLCVVIKTLFWYWYDRTFVNMRGQFRNTTEIAQKNVQKFLFENGDIRNRLSVGTWNRCSAMLYRGSCSTPAHHVCEPLREKDVGTVLDSRDVRPPHHTTLRTGKTSCRGYATPLDWRSFENIQTHASTHKQS